MNLWRLAVESGSAEPPDCAAGPAGMTVTGASSTADIALLPKLAELFDVPTEVLLGVTSAHASKSLASAGPRKPWRQLERLSRLPEAQQQVILAMLEGALLHHG